MKLTEYIIYLQVNVNNDIKIYKRNNEGALDKYDIQVQVEEIMKSI